MCMLHAELLLSAVLQAKCGYQPNDMEVPPLPTEHKHNMPKLKNKSVAARYNALSPGGPITQRFLAQHPVVLQIGSTIFVHAGVLPEHARFGLERMNRLGACTAHLLSVRTSCCSVLYIRVCVVRCQLRPRPCLTSCLSCAGSSAPLPSVYQNFRSPKPLFLQLQRYQELDAGQGPR